MHSCENTKPYATFSIPYDDEGLNDWVNQLDNGTSRETVFWGFANSQEFANLVASYGL